MKNEFYFLFLRNLIEYFHNQLPHSIKNMSKRKVSLDILRIYAACQVVSHHCFEYSLSLKTCYHLPLISEAIFSLMASCNIHLMLISSYLACKSKYTFSKQFPIIFSTIFHALFPYFNSIIFFKSKEYSFEVFLTFLFPIAHSIFWYTGPYLFSGLICSIIYPTLQKLNKRFHFSIIIIVVFFFIACNLLVIIKRWVYVLIPIRHFWLFPL